MSSYGPEYHKINTVFKRDGKRLLNGEWASPEFEYLKDMPWRWTEKVDGTNIRLNWNGGQAFAGGRTDQARIPNQLTDVIRPRLYLGAIFGDTPATVYCEGYGPKIQKGDRYTDTPGLIVFDVMVNGWWLGPDDVADVAAKLDLPVVPERGILTLSEAVFVVRDRRVMSNVAHKVGILAEGLVGTPMVPLYTRSGERIIAKIKVKDFPADPKQAALPVA